MKNELIVLDVDGTLIKSSVESEFRKYVLSSKRLTLLHYILAIISIFSNFILSVFFLPPRFLTYQFLASHKDLEHFLLNRRNYFHSHVNDNVMHILLEQLNVCSDFEILLLTGSPQPLVEELLVPILKEKLAIHGYIDLKISVKGSMFIPGNLVKENSFYGISKLTTIKSSFPSDKFEYTLAIGNERSDELQRLIFKKFVRIH